MVEGMSQGPLGANWGDGFGTSPEAVSILAQSGLQAGDPNPFFQKLMVRSLAKLDLCTDYNQIIAVYRNAALAGGASARRHCAG